MDERHRIDVDGRPAIAGQPCRLALIGSPRSGNTWLRQLLAASLGLEQRGAFRPDELNWVDLPARCIVQIHWRPDEPFRNLLARGGFRVVAPIRHPLDLLISILHFAAREPETARWLVGEGGDESSILGVTPRSKAFLKYATGPRAAALLSVGQAWWAEPDRVRLRYEDLVGDTKGTLARLIDKLGETPIRDVAGVIEAHTMERLRMASRNCHYWQGRPGLWRSLLIAPEARRIASAHRRVFDDLGYAVDPDEGLDARWADANWRRLDTPEDVVTVRLGPIALARRPGLRLAGRLPILSRRGRGPARP